MGDKRRDKCNFITVSKLKNNKTKQQQNTTTEQTNKSSGIYLSGLSRAITGILSRLPESSMSSLQWCRHQIQIESDLSTPQQPCLCYPTTYSSPTRSFLWLMRFTVRKDHNYVGPLMTFLHQQPAQNHLALGMHARRRGASISAPVSFFVSDGKRTCYLQYSVFPSSSGVKSRGCPQLGFCVGREFM